MKKILFGILFFAVYSAHAGIQVGPDLAAADRAPVIFNGTIAKVTVDLRHNILVQLRSRTGSMFYVRFTDDERILGAGLSGAIGKKMILRQESAYTRMTFTVE